jgi:hypothetical protein
MSLNLPQTDEGTYDVLTVASWLVANAGLAYAITVNDTTTDYSVPINAVISAVLANNDTPGGGVIVFPPGFYYIENPIVIPLSSGFPLTIVGSGWAASGGNEQAGTTIAVAYAAGDVFQISDSSTTVGGSALCIRDLNVDRLSWLEVATEVRGSSSSYTGFGDSTTIEVESDLGFTATGTYISIGTFYGLVTATSSTSLTVLQLSAGSGTFSNHQAVKLLGPTSGGTFNIQTSVNNVQYVSISGVSTNSDFDTLILSTAGSGFAVDNLLISNCIFVNIMHSFAHILGAVGGFRAQGCYVGGQFNGPYPNGANIALLIDLSSSFSDNVNELNWDGVDIESFASGIVCQIGGGSSFTDSSFNSISIDGATNVAAAYFKVESAMAYIQNLRFASCWFTANDPNVTGSSTPCVHLDGGTASSEPSITQINFTNCRFEGSNENASGVGAAPALEILNSVSNVAISGCELSSGSCGLNIGGNGPQRIAAAANLISGAYPGTSRLNNQVGVNIAPSAGGTIRDVVVSGNQIAGNLANGVIIDATASSTSRCSDIMICGNSVGGYAAGDAIQVRGSFTATPAQLVNVHAVDNAGYNPTGYLSAAPSPASGVAELNPFPFPVRIFMLIASTSTPVVSIASAYGGSFRDLPAAPNALILGVGEQLKVTYTGSVSWEWFGL